LCSPTAGAFSPAVLPFGAPPSSPWIWVTFWYQSKEALEEDEDENGSEEGDDGDDDGDDEDYE
jgi:hypothetical protein